MEIPIIAQARHVAVLVIHHAIIHPPLRHVPDVRVHAAAVVAEDVPHHVAAVVPAHQNLPHVQVVPTVVATGVRETALPAVQVAVQAVVPQAVPAVAVPVAVLLAPVNVKDNVQVNVRRVVTAATVAVVVPEVAPVHVRELAFSIVPELVTTPVTTHAPALAKHTVE